MIATSAAFVESVPLCVCEVLSAPCQLLSYLVEGVALGVSFVIQNGGCALGRGNIV